MKSSTGLTISRQTTQDMTFEDFFGGVGAASGRPLPRQRPKRATLGSQLRDLTQGLFWQEHSRYKFHTLNYSLSNQHEDTIGFSMADTVGGARKWNGQGNLTQFLLQAYYPAGIPAGPAKPLDKAEQAMYKAQAKAYAYLDRAKLTLAEPISELRSLPHVLNQPLHELDKSSRRFQRFLETSRTRRGLIRNVGHAYAYVQWALVPTVRTLDEIANEYADRLSVPNSLRQTARGKGSVASDVVRTVQNGSGSGWLWQLEQVRRVATEVHAGIVYNTTTARDFTVRGRLGLLARDIPSGLWESAPLTFMIDRILNVRRFVKVCSALASGDIKISRDSFVVVRQTDTRLVRFINFRPASIPQAYLSPNTTPYYSRVEFSMQRERWWPGLGDLASASRGTGLFDSLTKITDVLALSAGRLSMR